MSEQQDQAGRAGMLVVGIVLLVIGLSFIGNLGWDRVAPILGPVTVLVREIQRWMPGLALVAIGVLLVVYGSRGGLHMHRPAAGTRLHRSRKSKMVAGVLGGLGEYFSIDPTLLRLAFVAIALMTNLSVVLAYIVMAVVVPYEDEIAVTQAPTPPAAPPAPPAPPQG